MREAGSTEPVTHVVQLFLPDLGDVTITYEEGRTWDDERPTLIVNPDFDPERIRVIDPAGHTLSIGAPASGDRRVCTCGEGGARGSNGPNPTCPIDGWED